MQVYDASAPREGRNNKNPAHLETIKVTTYNEDRSSIEDTYFFMVQSYKTDLSLSERAKLFDISVCFEEDDKHKWIRINYPLDRVNIPELADFFYKEHSNREKLQLNFLRVPKIEQTYEDYYVVIRALLLDTQPDPLSKFFKNLPVNHIMISISNCRQRVMTILSLDNFFS